jgi:hypothetical protein
MDVPDRHHDLAVEHERRSWKSRECVYELGEISRERLAGFRLQLDSVAVPEHETAESVPLGLGVLKANRRNGLQWLTHVTTGFDVKSDLAIWLT